MFFEARRSLLAAFLTATFLLTADMMRAAETVSGMVGTSQIARAYEAAERMTSMPR
jgi:hypothetical protein